MMRLGGVIGISGFAIVMALLSSSSISIAAPAQVSAAAIDSLFAKFVSAHDPGCAVLVIKDGQPVFPKRLRRRRSANLAEDRSRKRTFAWRHSRSNLPPRR